MSVFFKILKKLWPSKIRYQLICGVALVHLLLMTFFVFDLVGRQRVFLRQQNLEQCKSLAYTIAINSSSWVLANDVAGLQEIVKSVRQYPGLRYAMVISTDGKVLAHTDKTIVGQYISDSKSCSLLHAAQKLQILVDNSSLLDIAVPVLSSTGELIGWARIGQGQEQITKNLTVISHNGLLYTLLAIVAGSILAFLIGYRLTKGLSRLLSISDQIRDGRRYLRIDTSGNDEVARLGAGLNQMLDAITAGEERYRIVADNTSDWEFWLDPEGKFIYVSPACECVTGHSVQEFMRDPELRLRITHPEDRAKYEAFMRKNIPVGHFESIQYRIIRLDGEVRWLEHVCRCIFGHNGKYLGRRGSNRDITDRKLAEAVILHAETYNRRLIEASLDPLVTIGPDGKITDVNSATENITGCLRQELIGTDFADYFSDPEKARAGYRQAFDKGFVHDYALDLKHRDGRISPVLYNASVYRDESGGVVGVFAAARDVTEIRKAEETVKRAAGYNRRLIEASLDPLVTIGPDGKITDVNSATENITGRSRQELAGTDFADYFSDPEKARAGYRQAFDKGFVHDYALDLKHRDGRISPVLYNVSVYRDESGEIVGVFAAARDVTEIRKLNEELEQRVHERTMELEQVNLKLKGRTDELEAFNKAMTGREKRMIELKEEVNRLCSELGRQPLYPPVWKQ